MEKRVERSGPMTPEKAAEYLGIAKSYLYNLVHFKKITYYKPTGKLLFFYQEDLDAFVRQGRRLADFELSKKADSILNGIQKRGIR